MDKEKNEPVKNKEPSKEIKDLLSSKPDDLPPAVSKNKGSEALDFTKIRNDEIIKPDFKAR